MKIGENMTINLVANFSLFDRLWRQKWQNCWKIIKIDHINRTFYQTTFILGIIHCFIGSSIYGWKYDDIPCGRCFSIWSIVTQKITKLLKNHQNWPYKPNILPNNIHIRNHSLFHRQLYKWVKIWQYSWWPMLFYLIDFDAKNGKIVEKSSKLTI